VPHQGTHGVVSNVECHRSDEARSSARIRARANPPSIPEQVRILSPLLALGPLAPAGRPPPSALIDAHAPQQRAADHEQHTSEMMEARSSRVTPGHDLDQQRPQHVANWPIMLKKPKNSAFLPSGTNGQNSERDRLCTPPPSTRPTVTARA
jgi:hypothetical protein